jgi:hypothetical protein
LKEIIMKRFLLPVGAILLSSMPALATTITCGVVSAADPSTGQLKLTDGSEYRVAAPIILTGMAPGRHVRVTVNDNKTVGVTDDNRFSQSPQDGGPGQCLAP